MKIFILEIHLLCPIVIPIETERQLEMTCIYISELNYLQYPVCQQNPCSLYIFHHPFHDKIMKLACLLPLSAFLYCFLSQEYLEGERNPRSLLKFCQCLHVKCLYVSRHSLFTGKSTFIINIYQSVNVFNFHFKICANLKRKRYFCCPMDKEKGKHFLTL